MKTRILENMCPHHEPDGPQYFSDELKVILTNVSSQMLRREIHQRSANLQNPGEIVSK